RGEKINEYGVMIEETEELVKFESEKSFFAHFGLQEIPPEMREAKGEVEAFSHSVPVLRPEDINGDLHMHTTWSDGAESVEEMVQYGWSLGYKYKAITEHSTIPRVVNSIK